MKKTYILDTNILIQTPYSIYGFEDNDVVITPTTLEELDGLKDAPGETGYNAREAIRILGELKNNGDMLKGIKLPGGGDFRVEFNHIQEDLPEGWSIQKPDNRIIQCAKALNNITDNKAILVTNDVSMQIKASIAGALVENYKNTQVAMDSMKYTGRRDVYANEFSFNKFTKEKGMDVSDLYAEDELKLINNEFLIIHNCSNPDSTQLGVYRNGIIQPLRYAKCNPAGITPRNVGQIFAQEALMMPASEVPLVILKGPAGTAKTFYSLAVGIDKVVDCKEYRTLLITRPNVKFDEDIGYLKGDEMDKIAPLIRPCYDNLELLLTKDIKSEEKEIMDSKIDYLFQKGMIKAEAMAYMRGRSLSNLYMLVDECQNSTPNQILGLITRAGLDTKIVITGDIKQIDNPKLDKRNNGLSFASERMKGSDLCMQVAFDDEKECVRSALAREAAERLTANVRYNFK
jgi:PhoH-like ATPase